MRKFKGEMNIRMALALGEKVLAIPLIPQIHASTGFATRSFDVGKTVSLTVRLNNELHIPCSSTAESQKSSLTCPCCRIGLYETLRRQEKKMLLQISWLPAK